jgi:hypothetical protein
MLSLAAMAAAACTASVANAATVLAFDSVGDNYTVNFNGETGSPLAVMPGLSAKIVYSLSSIGNSGKAWNFSYTITDTSAAPVTASTITAFGFDANPNFSSASNLTGLFGNFSSTGEPGGVPSSVDFCLTDHSGNCSGSNGGLGQGNSANGSFRLNFSSAKSEVDFGSLFVRYEDVRSGHTYDLHRDDEGDDDEGGGIKGVGFPTAGVPEPASWALMITGFGMAGATLRRRRVAVA